jgi:hypothetical protein
MITGRLEEHASPLPGTISTIQQGCRPARQRGGQRTGGIARDAGSVVLAAAAKPARDASG